MDDMLKWIRPNMNLYYVGENREHIIAVSNSGNLAADFKKYADNFFDSAVYVNHYLVRDAVARHNISKHDLWYFAMIYLYRQSLELLLKADIFQVVTSNQDRKDIVGNIRHDLQQGFEKLIELRKLTIDNNENAKWLMAFLSDISHIDRESDMFRYPFGSNLNVLFKRQTYISLLATHKNMDKAYKILKDIYDTGTFTDQNYKAYSPQLIIEGGYYYQQSVVGYKFAERSFYPYYSSYERVGRFLKDLIINQSKNELFMPMCYMYRNAVELGLKRLIIEDSHIERTRALKILKKKKHSILGLWNSIADEINEYSKAPDGGSTLDNAIEYIQAFHDFDLGSDLFRYPCNKNLKTYFLTNKNFDIENVSSCFQELCNFLDAVHSTLTEIKGLEAEMASYFTNY